MPRIDDNLELHLALDEIADGLALDETENSNDGVVNGHTALVADELFGSCFRFNGTDSFVEAEDPFPDLEAFTVAVWARPAALDGGAYHGFVGHQQGDVRKPSMWLAPAGGLHYDSYGADGKRWDGILDNFFTRPDAWVHVAWVKEGAQYRFYRGGELFGSPAPAPAQFQRDAAAGYRVGRVDNFWNGQMAHLRVYSRALSQEEVRQVMLDDQTAGASFQLSHPLEFSAYDEDEQPVLVVDDGHGGRKLRVEVFNASRRVVELARPAAPRAAADNHHFELRFRPGTLSANALSALALEAQDGWDMARAQAVDGTVSLYFVGDAPPGAALALRPGERLVLTLLSVSADGAGGARGTRVELRYRQVNFSGETAQFRGSRVRHLNIVNERGRRNIPLHVGFLGSNTVLNDGCTPNELRLRITNTLGERQIPVTPGPGQEASAFALSFDVQGPGEQKEWAVAASDAVEKFHIVAVRTVDGREVEDTDWGSVFLGGEGGTPVWEVKSTGKEALGPGGSIQLRISNVYTSLPSGPTSLYVNYRNLPGYWDGQFVVGLEKSPLVQRGSGVGLGTVEPRSGFDTGTAVLTGSAAAFQKAQAMMTGGGTVTWGGPGERLKWTKRFIAISFEVSEALPRGHVNISPPTGAIPAEHVWDGKARPAGADGVLLHDWEALYAVHRPGDDENAVHLRIESYQSFVNGRRFTVPSNWLLVAAVNHDDGTVRLGTGVTLSAKTSSTNGSPIPVGTIMMWSGHAGNIPGGWALCDGKDGTPNLQDRFVLGAGASNAGQSGEADQHTHSFSVPPANFGTTNGGDHAHNFPGWYKRELGYLAAEKTYYSLIDSNGGDPRSQSTTWGGEHAHQVTVRYDALATAPAAANRPRWYALCYIMKL